MKKFLALILSIAMIFTMVIPISAAADDYVFTILVDGKSTSTAQVGDTITVSLTLEDPTEGDTMNVYIFQDYILYNPDQLALDADSIQTPDSIVDVSTHSFDDEGMSKDAVYVNRSATNSTAITNGATLVTFEMEVLTEGTLVLLHHEIEVVDADGNTATDVDGETATITVGDDDDDDDDTSSSGGTSSGGGGGGGESTVAEEEEITTEFEDLIEETPEGGTIDATDERYRDWVFTLYDLERMAERYQTLVRTADGVVYSMRAYAVDTEAVWEELSVVNSKLVPVTVEINELTPEDVDLQYGNLIANPWTFDVIGTLNGNTSIMEVFSLYVRRTMEITEEEAAVITTALILEDNDQRHVPTNVYEEDGQWYACVSCHTNGAPFAFTDFTDSFDDVADTWYTDITLEMADRRIVYGVGEGLYEGERAVTRAEFAAIVVRGLGFSDVGTSDFPDVDDDDWYAGAVGRAYELGIVYGRDTGEFDPESPIIREEAMAMIARASVIAELDSVEGEAITEFDDVADISAWALSEVEFNISNNLIIGYNRMILPQDSITRAETAAVMIRLLREADLVDVRS